LIEIISNDCFFLSFGTRGLNSMLDLFRDEMGREGTSDPPYLGCLPPGPEPGLVYHGSKLVPPNEFPTRFSALFTATRDVNF